MGALPISPSNMQSVDWQQPVSTHPLNRGLVSWWLAGPNQTGFGSLTWRDLKGQNDGVVIGSSGAAGWKRGERSSFDFNGSDDYVIVADDTAPALGLMGTDFTVSMWVKPLSVSIDQYMVSKRSVPQNSGWACFIDAGGEISFVMFGVAEYQSTGLVTAGVWQQIVYVHDDVGNTLTYYRDGSSIDSDSVGTIKLASPGYDLLIGAVSTAGGPDIWLQGDIDDVRIYNRALSAPQVADLYQRSRKHNQGLLRQRPIVIGYGQAAAVGFIDNTNPIWRHIGSCV